MKFGIVVLPGSNCDHDALHVTRDVLGAEVDVLWHKETDLRGADCVIIPGGFAYGDYLRAGALAKFAPVMEPIRRHAAAGGLVFGICNGFQVLTEAGLLPGALMRNEHLRFVSRDVFLRVEETDTPLHASWSAVRYCACRSRMVKETTSRMTTPSMSWSATGRSSFDIVMPRGGSRVNRIRTDRRAISPASATPRGTCSA